MPNKARGEFDAPIGGLTLHIIPSYGRVSRAEAAISRSCINIAQSGGDMRVSEIAMFLSQVSNPKIKHEVIGKAVMGHFEDGLKAVMRVIEVVTETDEDEDDVPDDFPVDDDSGNE